MAAALGRCAFAFYLLHAVASQDLSLLEFSENPVYNGSRLSLTCKFSYNVALSEVTMDAFNGTRPVGRLHCIVSKNTTKGTGVFYGKHFTGCPSYVATSGTVNVSIDASPNLELLYNCSVRVSDDKNFYNWTSNSTLLQVRVLPSVPKLVPEHLSFNDSDSIELKCLSSHGVPPAHVKLTVSNQYGALNMSEGNYSVSLNVSVSRTWHNAVALCQVTNHPVVARNLSITVNHIAIDSEPPLLYTDSGDNVLNCSDKIAVYPSATYMWSIPGGFYVNESLRRSSVFKVNQGESGAFNCTATNSVTNKTVIVLFHVTNTTRSVKHQIPKYTYDHQIPQYTYDLWIWALPIIGFLIIILIVILFVLYKRGYIEKGRLNTPSRMSGPAQSLNNSGCDQDGEVAMTENVIYDAFVSQPCDGVHSTNHFGSAFASCEGRLLVAAEGAAANLKHKILSTTVLVEFADRSCSLEGILAKINEVKSSPSPTSFKSMAILLRSCEAGVIISEVDRAVLTSTSLSGAKGKPLRDFFTRLADICLDRQGHSGRIDILNYNSSDATKLSKRLTDLIKVHVTVTSDLFGITQSTQNIGENIAVGDDYFHRSRLDEVVYADLEPLVGRKDFRPRKDNDQVLYSDVALKA